MVWAKRRDEWDHTATLRGHLANMFRDTASAAVHPWQFHPLRQYVAETKKKSVTVKQLTAAFVGL